MALHVLRGHHERVLRGMVDQLLWRVPGFEDIAFETNDDAA